MILTLLLVVTFVAVGYFVIEPLLGTGVEDSRFERQEETSLKLRKKSLYRQIKESELEHEMGMLSTEDFLRTKRELKEQVVRLISADQSKSS